MTLKLFCMLMLFVCGFVAGDYYRRAETRKAFDAVGIREIVKSGLTVRGVTAVSRVTTNTYQVVWADGKKANK